MKITFIRVFTFLLISFQSLNVFSNPKLKEFSFPDIGFSIYFPKESKKKIEDKITIRYHFEQFDDKGKNIGTATFSVYPNFLNDDIQDVINQITDEIKAFKVGNSVQVKSTDRTVQKGFYEFVTIHSEYLFTNESFTIKREDYLYKGCKGLVHVSFMVPTYNCYLTQSDRDYIVNKSLKWYDKDSNKSALDIKYTLPVGVFKSYNTPDNKGFTLKPCISDYKSEIEVAKLGYTGSDFAKAAELYFAEKNKDTKKYVDWGSYKAPILKRENTAFSYEFMVQGKQYNLTEFLIRSEGVYYVVRVVSTCTDIDGCNYGFMAEVERFIETIQTVAPKKVEEDDYDYDYFGW